MYLVRIAKRLIQPFWIRMFICWAMRQRALHTFDWHSTLIARVMRTHIKRKRLGSGTNAMPNGKMFISIAVWLAILAPQRHSISVRIINKDNSNETVLSCRFMQQKCKSCSWSSLFFFLPRWEYKCARKRKKMQKQNSSWIFKSTKIQHVSNFKQAKLN